MKNSIKLSWRAIAPHDRFWNPMSPQSIRRAANQLLQPFCVCLNYAQILLRQGSHKGLYGYSENNFSRLKHSFTWFWLMPLAYSELSARPGLTTSGIKEPLQHRKELGNKKKGGEYLEPVATIYCVSLKSDNYAGSLVSVGFQAFQSNIKKLYIVSGGAKYSPP